MQIIIIKKLHVMKEKGMIPTISMTIYLFDILYNKKEFDAATFALKQVKTAHISPMKIIPWMMDLTNKI